MVLELKQINSKEEFGPLVNVEHEAYANPLNSFWEILRGPSIEECRERQWSWHKADPQSNWFQVVDTDTGEVVGGTQWVVNEVDPFEKPVPTIKATWWEEGSDLRSITDRMLEHFFFTRSKRMNRPHLLVGYCFVSPNHRRRGVGKKLMDWGCELADKKNLECFVESTEDGRALYESMGFIVVGYFYLNPFPETGAGTPSKEWTKIKEEAFPEPYRVWVMWRPKGGKFVEGVTKYSWEE